MTDEILYIDTHEVAVTAEPVVVWAALRPALDAAWNRKPARMIGRLLACEDDGASGESVAGFHVACSVPPRELVLEGRHRFSRYRLAFEVEPADTGSRLRAVTHAQFPGALGRLYRSLVVGSGGHRIVTRRLLRSIARRAEGAQRAPSGAPAYVLKEES